ncbi:MAG: DNA-binding protein WhiA [Ruminococcaceae bacterium]|nr:DNA-binding protein WhiA [Oscillospiraceae bacterium]
MSFSQDVKAELAATPPRMPCCRRALLFGLLYDSQAEGDKLTATYSDISTAELCVNLIKFAYGRQADVSELRRGAHKYLAISFNSKNAVKKLELFIRTRDASVIFECPECASAFVRGVFMATGSISAPSSATHLEMKHAHVERVGNLFDILCGLGLQPLTSKKDNDFRFYYKNRSAVQDFMSYIGGNQAVFEMVNYQLQKDLRNDENRATNCVTRNISRSITASAKQIQTIRDIQTRGLIEAMPPKLRRTAELRLANPEATIEELAALHTPPISKSGANHRIEKIMAWCESHLQK